MGNYQTKKRPPTEPYEFWAARREAQADDLKQYLKGRVFHTGSTYVAPRCPFCDKKENKCKCWKETR